MLYYFVCEVFPITFPAVFLIIDHGFLCRVVILKQRKTVSVHVVFAFAFRTERSFRFLHMPAAFKTARLGYELKSTFALRMYEAAVILHGLSAGRTPGRKYHFK